MCHPPALKATVANIAHRTDHFVCAHVQAEQGVAESADDAQQHVHGPFFSWLNPTEDTLLAAATDRTQILHAVRAVLDVVESDGPFDGIYGFSEVRCRR